MESAPDVLRVNADFDEQKMDATTPFAKGDCEDEDLKAASGPDAGKIIVKDLFNGFFGVNPDALPAACYSDATVTIEKLAEKDSETNQPETGEVRFYATKDQGKSGEQFWPILTTGSSGSGGNTLINLASVLYGPNPSVPRGKDTQYWIEGIKAGPITLEFKYTNGSTTFSHKQKFLVATQQSKTDWQKEIRQQILLQTKASGAVDMALYLSSWGSAPFITNKAYIQNVYGYYEYLHRKKPDLFLWAGLAKMAGGGVYAGMGDAEYARTLGPIGTSILANPVADFFQKNLMRGNYDIFDDLAWQFRAYQASGIWALRYVDENAQDTPHMLAIDIDPWEIMWQGEYSNSIGSIQFANLLLTDREQRNIVQPAWTSFKTSGVTGIEFLLDILAESPLLDVVPNAAPFRVVVSPTGDITSFPDRWLWISDPARGIWHDWTGLSTSTRRGFTGIRLQTRAAQFSWFSPFGFPIIW